MHLAIILITIFAAWKWGDWKNWRKYHNTMLFLAIGNLLYNFIYSNHLLWELRPYLLYSHKVGEIFYTFIVFPLTGLIFLTNYPKTIKDQVLHIAKFVTIYIVIEYILYMFGKTVYNYGWNIWWSLAWNCMMFPMWALHYKKPFMAYGASFIVIIIILMIFPISFK